MMFPFRSNHKPGMKKFTTAKIATLFSVTLSCLALSAGAQAATPTQKSVDRLLDDMHIEKVLDAIKPQLDGMLKQSEQQALNGKVPSPAEQKILDKFHTKMVGIVNSHLNMDLFRPIYVRVYTKSFNQEEVDGLTTFLESPAGKAYVDKLPIAMQSVMAEMPTVMAPMTRDIQAAAKEMNDEIAALPKQGAK